jgi:hypothetical protein
MCVDVDVAAAAAVDDDDIVSWMTLTPVVPSLLGGATLMMAGVVQVASSIA